MTNFPHTNKSQSSNLELNWLQLSHQSLHRLFTDIVPNEQISKEIEAITQYICADVFADGVGAPEIFELTTTHKVNK